jgi:hypothetical protein
MKPGCQNGRLGALGMGIICVWSATSTWLAAKGIIAVSTEFACYYITPFILIVASLYYVFNRGQPKTARSLVVRGAVATSVVAFVAVVWPLLLSNKAFFYWKMKAVPASAWPQMVSDIEKHGRQSMGADGSYGSFRSGTLPASLRQLGSGEDYLGGSGQMVAYSEYSGILAHVAFGYKPRTWGIMVGPEKAVTSFCPRCEWTRVAPNAYFFVGAKG